MWAFESEDSYVPGIFYGRLEDREDPQSIDQGVMTLAIKSLGQWTPAHDFRVLRTLLAQIDADLPQPKGFKADRKVMARATRNILRVIDASND
jgi:hypothetical protein